MQWSNKEVAVTGAAGFIGSYLCTALVAGGAKVRALDNFEFGSAANLDSLKERIQLFKCDITRVDDLGVLENAEVVFHLAALASPKICAENFEKAYRINVEGTRNVLRSCAPGSRVIFMSGAIVYGDPLYLPMDEKHPLGGRDPYSLTKIIGECLCWAMATARDLRPTVIRNFTTYGPGQSGDYVIPSLARRALKEKRIDVWNDRPSRDFTYVEDTVDALLRIAERPSLVGEAVNLGSGIETDIGSLAKAISEIAGNVPVVNLDREVVGSVRQACDNRKLAEATGWSPKIPLREGLRRTVEALKRELAASPGNLS